MKVTSLKGALFLFGCFLFLTPLLTSAQTLCENIVVPKYSSDITSFLATTSIQDCRVPLGEIQSMVVPDILNSNNVVAFQSDVNQNNVDDSTEADVVVSANATLSPGEYNFNNLTISNSAVLTLEGNLESSENFKGVKINATNVTITPGSRITADGRGYITGPGTPDSSGESSASYGGKGGGPTAKPTYGSATTPTDLGSGDGGNPGGGAIRLDVSDTLKNDGIISANGQRERTSGGSIYVITNRLTGSGVFDAHGGNGAWPHLGAGAGAGGRIALYYQDTTFTGTATARGGVSCFYGCNQAGEDGTVVMDVVEPVCAENCFSNILFLPGIQASRLYTNENGTEEKLWEPGGNSDVARLGMTSSGESITNIYTKDVVDEVGGVAVGGNVYKGFLRYLIDMDGDGGPLVATFPYDWRRNVFDIVDEGTQIENGEMVRPTESVESLATLSPTGKVTLIAHSNGGLLAKAIMLKLEEEGNVDLVDKVIFIASPHLGTPKGLMALLHGYDQDLGAGFVADDEVVRSVMQNMGGVYGLLPSEKYLQGLDTPLISFDDSGTTALYRNRYGFAVTNMDEYRSFLKGEEGRPDAGLRVNEPTKANESMLTSSLTNHQTSLDDWTAPVGVEVFNIVGTGLVTPKSIEYKEFIDMTCTVLGGCRRAPKLEPVIHFTRYGDETVVSKSAKASETENQFYFDSSRAGRGVTNLTYSHAEITESSQVQSLLGRILHASSTDDIPFVSKTEPVPSETDNSLDIVTIHSPARIYLRDTNGNVTGRTEAGNIIQEEISGSSYFEAGSVKYVIVPSSISYDVIIQGEEDGVYTNSITRFSDDTEEVMHTYTASVTPQTIVTYKKSGEEFSTVSVDANGDGVFETEMTVDGEVIEKPATYDDLENAIKNLGLPRAHTKVLLALVSVAEKLSFKQPKKDKKEKRHKKHWHKKHFQEEQALQVLEKTIELYAKKKMITKIEAESIKTIIMKLINQ